MQAIVLIFFAGASGTDHPGKPEGSSHYGKARRDLLWDPGLAIFPATKIPLQS